MGLNQHPALHLGKSLKRSKCLRRGLPSANHQAQWTDRSRPMLPPRASHRGSCGREKRRLMNVNHGRVARWVCGRHPSSACGLGGLTCFCWLERFVHGCLRRVAFNPDGCKLTDFSVTAGYGRCRPYHPAGINAGRFPQACSLDPGQWTSLRTSPALHQAHQTRIVVRRIS